MTAMMMMGAAYRRGMFFDESFYKWEWAICIGALSAVGVVLLHNRRRREESRMRGMLHPAVIGSLMAALLYGSTLLHDPVSVLGSLKQALRYFTYAAFALLLQLFFGSPEKRAGLSAALQASGMAVAGCALAGWMGALSFPSMIMTTEDGRLSAVGARLAGFVQYPNFLGAVAAAYLVWSGLLLLRADTYKRLMLASIGAVPYLLVCLLTESRGAWLAAAIAWLTGFAMLRGKERCAWALYGGWTLVCGSAAYRAVVGAGLRGRHDGTGGGANAQEWLLLLLIICAAPLGFLGIRMLMDRSGKGRLKGIAWACGSAAALVSVALLPETIFGRLGGFGGDAYSTAGARRLFYRDAWKLVREAPLLGRGGDAWPNLFTSVQSQPYVGNEVHSGILELLLDLGAVGLIAGIAVIVIILRAVWIRERMGLLPIGVLLMHALIDFDLSFGYDWLLLLSWIVYYSSGGALREGGGVGREVIRGRIAAGVRAGALASAALCFAAAAVLGWRLAAAVQHRETAAAVSGAARTAALRAALDANPYWSRIRIELAVQAPPPERAALLAAGLRWEPQSVPLLWALGREAAEREDVRGAAGWMRRALDRDRFDRAKQTEAVTTMARLAQNLRAASRPEEARLAADAAEAFFASYEALDRRYDANGRRFEVSAAAKTAAEQIRLLASKQ
ncbi:O-antigen ligase [Paenibacillus sacheonensis]|nr:O-antigen ligase [Paenibacillus sacheonensis]